MTTVKLSSKNQVVVPREAREALGVGAGDEILIVPKGDVVIITRKPPDIVKALYGSGKGMYGDVKRYLRRERASWTSRKSRRF
jgi:AbrB family looped-hinge helix DNA binding protein